MENELKLKQASTQSNWLGTEKISKLFFKFTIPCVTSLIISCLYNIVDEIFIGNGVGVSAISATGITFPLTVIGWALSLLFGDGAAAYMSMSQGSNDTSKVHRAVGNAMAGSFATGAVLILICYLANLNGNRLFMFIGATSETVDMVRDYAFIVFAMLPLALVQNTLAAVIRADGKPLFAMFAMAVGAIFNIGGDAVAIFVFKLGIKGAAYATIIGQFISFVICIAYLFKSNTFKIDKSSFIPDFKLLLRIVSLGLSSFITQMFIVIVTLVNNILLAKYGAVSKFGSTVAISAFVVIMKLFQILINVAIGIAAGCQPLVGYNYGANNQKRVLSLLKWILGSTTIVLLVCTAIIEFFPNIFVVMFGGGNDPLFTEFATKCIRLYLVCITFTCLNKATAIFMQSIGEMKIASPLSLIRETCLVILSCTLPLAFASDKAVEGIFYSAPIADTIAMIVTAIAVVYEVMKIKKASAAFSPMPTVAAQEPNTAE